MRGYFGIGAEDISKPMNVGALMRTAHAFGSSFFFTINAHPKVREAYNSDTSRSFEHMPYYPFENLDALRLPKGCTLVGVELTDDAIDLPAFKHPNPAAYVLGRERGSLSPALLSLCAHVVKIPTKFCINVGLAGALVCYDRALSIGGYPARPVRPGGPPPELNQKPKPI
jgi:tRNA G18 (ribose-2'-O)-methylase SpoU